MKTQALFLWLLLLLTPALAQNTSHQYSLDFLESDTHNIIRAQDYPWQAGDTLCIPAGTYAGIRFYDLQGTVEQPIVIMNCGGPVELVESQHSALEFQRSAHVRFTGSGVESLLYGIEIKALKDGAQGINITNLSTDIELDHLEIAEAGFAGIMAKTDPVCSLPEGWRSAGYVMRNIRIHDNNIHHTLGEGIYIGYTGSTVWNSNRACGGEVIYGHWSEGIEVYDNLISYTGLDAIQLNLVQEGGVIYNNRIHNFGLNESTFQDYAMSLGAGDYEVFNNEIINNRADRGRGIQVISATSGLSIYNNLLVRPRGHGIFLHMRAPFDSPEGYFIAQNTVVEPAESGIHFNSTITEGPEHLIGQQQDQAPLWLINNLVISPGNRFEMDNTWKGEQESYFDFNNRSTRDALEQFQQTNLLTRRPDTLYLRDASRDDYRLMDGRSPLLNTGTDLTDWGVLFDIEDKARPFGEGYDIGAYEGQVVPVIETPPTPVVEPAQQAVFRFWPNPAKERIFISTQTASLQKLRLITPDGRVAMEEVHPQADQGINLPKLPQGLYFLELKWEDGRSQVARLLLED